eukprot:EG_transcript_34977
MGLLRAGDGKAKGLNTAACGSGVAVNQHCVEVPVRRATMLAVVRNEPSMLIPESRSRKIASMSCTSIWVVSRRLKCLRHPSVGCESAINSAGAVVWLRYIGPLEGWLQHRLSLQFTVLSTATQIHLLIRVI